MKELLALMATYELWICQDLHTEEFPFRDISLRMPNRETAKDIVDLIGSETLLKNMLSDSTGEEWFFDPAAPLSLRAVEVGDDHIARPFATRGLERDADAPQIPAEKAESISAFLKRAGKIMQERANESKRVPRPRIEIISRTVYQNGSPINGLQTGFSVYDRDEIEPLVSGIVFDVPFQDVVNWIHAHHYTLLGRRADLSTEKGEE
jgi:hypothetical protein